MTPSADETRLIQLLESLGPINTGEKLIAWAQKDLQGIFPHGAFICGIGRVHRAGVAPVKYFASNFPLDYLRALKQS